ncbi:MAG: hypothetical protein DRQ88_08065 [Epsilonproteobacteria bacterium]|nr:MAG: hypothetical protein DRQ89_09085 [Campylobacterota bacterium]RLA66007.1 MAG: hypothetical protein DRQ88_08065 [Campylobacterota bacterium]
MKKLNFTFLLILGLGLYSTQGWAPPPGKGGASASPEFNSKTCEINSTEQTKVELLDKSGKKQFICTGMSICGGIAVPVSCKVSEREPCPVATKCLELLPGDFLKSCSGSFQVNFKGRDLSMNFDYCKGYIERYRQSYAVQISGFSYILNSRGQRTNDEWRFIFNINLHHNQGVLVIGKGRDIYRFSFEDPSKKQIKGLLNKKDFSLELVDKINTLDKKSTIKKGSKFKGAFK